ncbi:hypothetical protein BpHYR1_040023 [Brachionus plicatilis]|uniref:PHD-type domain-containing protein n=1 Tax=Brachionus plicatilis TaxID=10195 RepID=A0A3M7T1L5_BRAPC|nr:hypothetical protein BpHYR1_040023 [Brachionus plicatilis]
MSITFGNDIFLKNFELENLKEFSEKNVWIEVQTKARKLKKSTCPICKNHCLEKCIECDSCQYWYHFKCAKVSRYHLSGICFC